MERPTKYCYQMSASGFGTRKYCFNSPTECLEAMQEDAGEMAYEMDGEVQMYNDKEFVVTTRDGEEIARFEALFESSPKWRKINEETYEDRVDRAYKDAVSKYRAERQSIKDRIRDIVGDDKADEVFNYWDRIQSSFNSSWRQDGVYGTCEEHLARLSEILGPEGKDIIDDIERKYARQAKELSDYYDTHDYTGD